MKVILDGAQILKGENMWQSQNPSVEAQQDDRPDLQITLQEVIDMISNTAQKKMMQADASQEKTMQVDASQEKTMQADTS